MILINYFQNHFHSWSCSNHFDEIFSKIRRGFRKGFGAQHSLLLMIGKWKKKKKTSWWQQSFWYNFYKLIKRIWVYLPWSRCCKTTCLWSVTFCFENDWRMPSWILILYMEENHTWCFLRINLRTPVVQHVFIWFMWYQLCRWHHSLYCFKHYNRSNRESNKYHVQTLYVVC